jgi:hypothetical protein
VGTKGELPSVYAGRQLADGRWEVLAHDEPGAVLLGLSMRHVDSAGITFGHLCDLADEIVRRAGGVEAGIQALEDGSLHLDRANEG